MKLCQLTYEPSRCSDNMISLRSITTKEHDKFGVIRVSTYRSIVKVYVQDLNLLDVAMILDLYLDIIILYSHHNVQILLRKHALRNSDHSNYKSCSYISDLIDSKDLNAISDPSDTIVKASKL